MEPDPANVVCEGHAIKGFVSLINRRLYASSKRRDSCQKFCSCVFCVIRADFLDSSLFAF